MLDTDATPFERELLQASAVERPPPELLLGMQQALGIAPSVVPTPDASAGAARPAPVGGQGAGSWASGTALKLGIGAVVGGGVLVAALSLRPSAQPAAVESPKAARTIAAPPPATIAPPVAPAPVAEVAASATDPARELRLEIELLDRARAALGSNQAARAVELLDQYAARFPAGSLAREAEVLRSKARAKLRPAREPATLAAPAGKSPRRP
jgi:hypothetical protein